MDHQLSIYQINVQSADKLDERRDATTRAYGGLSVVAATAAVSMLQDFPLVSAVLFAFLIAIALSWRATIDSLTAKLAAKNELLTKMEGPQDCPFRFLTQERKAWQALERQPLQKALKRAPHAFLILGTMGLLGTLARITSGIVCF
ncbi:MAG: hypothetical protein OXI73_15805 [Rhodospirillales bacterium]|nr:hypothetical protein [Rhodospirillales bacterium]